MKIALCYDEVLPPRAYGGVQRIVMNLAHEYQRLGHEVFLLAGVGSHLPSFEHGIYPKPWNAVDYATLVPSDVDFIHVHQPDKVPSSKPYLMTVHGNGSPGEKYLPNTNFVSRSHARNHNSDLVVLQAIDVDHYPFVAEKQDYVVFMAVAKWRVKNLKTCIDYAQDNRVKLKVIGGSGRNSRYVEYLGMMGDQDGRLDVLAGARALLYPTNWDEPCALAPLEAMACGTPVVSSINGAMPEEIPPVLGFLCETYHQFRDAHRDLDRIRPEALREHVRSHFSVQRQAQDYLNLYDRILIEGELQQSPESKFNPATVKYLYKPTFWNRAVLALKGRI